MKIENLKDEIFVIQSIIICNGKQNELEWHAVLLNEADNKLCQFIITGQNISHRKEGAAKIKPAKKSLRMLNLRLQRMKEAEGEYLSRQILENIVQTLTSLGFEVSELEKLTDHGELDKKRTVISRHLNDMKKTLKALIQTGRDLSSTIRPTVLDNLGLAAALLWYVTEFEIKNSIVCDTSQISEQVSIDTETGIVIFRVCQEIFCNIVKHANASKVCIVLTEGEKDLFLKITDNGCGIPRKKISSPESLGMLKIRECVKYLGGKVYVRGKKNIGTSIIISFPKKS